MYRSVFRALASSLLLFCGATLAPALDRWVEVNSPHFSVVTDAGEGRAREVAMQFEQMRSVFAQLFAKDMVHQSIPLQIVVLKSEQQLSKYAPTFQGKPVKIAGFYLHSQDKDFIAVDVSASNGWETVFHEYAHLLLNSNFPALPAWFQEGFAEYYSTIQVEQKQVAIGATPKYAPSVLSKEPLMPINNLFRVTQGSPIYNDDQSHRTLFYAESWLVVHYLFDSRQLGKAQEYFDLLRQRVPVATAIEKAFGKKPEELDREIDEYYRLVKKVVIAPLPGGKENVTFASTPLSSLDAEAVLAELHSHESEYHAQAIKEFERILQQEPDNSVAHRGLAYTYLQDGALDAALPHFLKTVGKNSNDWLLHYYWATFIAKKQDDSLIAQMESEARLVTQLNPEMADGHGLLGFALMSQHKIDGAAQAYAEALHLSPGNEVYAINLAELYTLQGKQQEAYELFRYLQHSSNNQISTAARSHLELMPREPGEKKSQ